MKTYILCALIAALLPITGSADSFLLVSSTNQIPASLPDGVGIVLRGATDSNTPAFLPSGDGRLNNSEHWYFERGGKDAAQFPAFYDFGAAQFVPLTGTVAQAVSNSAAMTSALADVPTVISTPVQISTGIILAPAIGGTNGFALALDPAGNWITTHWFGSPTDNVATIRASFTSAKTNAESYRADLRQLRTDLTATVQDLNTNIDKTVFTGAQRVQFENLRADCEALAREVQRLRKAVLNQYKDANL